MIKNILIAATAAAVMCFAGAASAAPYIAPAAPVFTEAIPAAPVPTDINIVSVLATAVVILALFAGAPLVGRRPRARQGSSRPFLHQALSLIAADPPKRLVPT